MVLARCVADPADSSGCGRRRALGSSRSACSPCLASVDPAERPETLRAACNRSASSALPIRCDPWPPLRCGPRRARPRGEDADGRPRVHRCRDRAGARPRGGRGPRAVHPADKLELVAALRIARSGDGRRDRVNDAPALRGRRRHRDGCVRTEAAREASSLVITDDDSPTIVAAVGGRAAGGLRATCARSSLSCSRPTSVRCCSSPWRSAPAWAHR